MAAATDGRPSYRSSEHRPDSDHPPRLAPAARRQHCRIPVPAARVPGRLVNFMTTRRTALTALAAPFIARGAKATAFALIGDRYHNSDYIRTGLGRTIGRDA